jgi:hypothetical protein
VSDRNVSWEPLLISDNFSIFKNALGIWPVLIPDYFDGLDNALILQAISISRFADGIGVYLEVFKGLNCIGTL